MTEKQNNTFYLDRLEMYKVGRSMAGRGNGTAALLVVPTVGFLANPDFSLGHQYWKYASSSGTLRHNPILGKNVFSIQRGKLVDILSAHVHKINLFL